TEIARANGNIASLTLEFGEVARSFEAHLAAVEAAERWGLARATTWFRGERPEDDYHAGRWDAAQRRAEPATAEIEAGAPHYQEPTLRVFRALIRLARGDSVGALRDARRALEVGRSVGDAQAFQPSLAISAFIEFQAGNAAEARQRLDELIELWR